MKIQDLLTPPTLIIKEAPEIGPDQPIGLADPKILNQLEPTGQDIEGIDLYAKKFGDQVVFALKREVILTLLIGTEITDFPGQMQKPTIIIGRTWTNPNVRGTGYSPALIDGLGKLGYRILSDRQISKNALQVWNKIAQKHQPKGFDWSTKQYTDENPTDNPNISFVLEHIVCFARLPILKDSKCWICD